MAGTSMDFGPNATSVVAAVTAAAADRKLSVAIEIQRALDRLQLASTQISPCLSVSFPRLLSHSVSIEASARGSH